VSVPEPLPPGVGRIAQVNGLYSVLVKDLDEFERTLCHAGAIDGYYDPEIHAGTVRFGTGVGAHDAAKRLDG
jgi:hypothetical protein